MKKKKPDPVDRFLALSDAQKEAEVAPFDREDVGAKTRGLTAAERRRWERAKRGRPKIGQGSKIVPVSLERGLLKQVNAFAKAHGLKRSQMVSEGLRMIMVRAKAS